MGKFPKFYEKFTQRAFPRQYFPFFHFITLFFSLHLDNFVIFCKI